MKQVLQSLKSGVTHLAEVPAPTAGANSVLIETRCSLISAGTERMLVDFGRSNWVKRAQSQPEKVQQALQKIRTDGLVATYQAVSSKLETPLPMGYCNVGVVVDVGIGVPNFKVGERVVSNGAHAQIVNVPSTLVARVPDNVSDEHASFTVIGAVGLQGIRLLAPTLGETVVVIGLGLIGLLVVQMLKANGCHMIGIDRNPERLRLANQFGASTIDISGGQDVVDAVLALTNGIGADGVLIATATSESDPVQQAAKMSRKRGRIVLIGTSGLELSRADFYEKELSFQVSCSYGPGRYDPAYEQGGNDYPLPFVRWTAQRNFEAVLMMMAQQKLQLDQLISHRFEFDRAQDAYDVVMGNQPSIGVLLKYQEDREVRRRLIVYKERAPAADKQTSPIIAGVIGAGNFGTGVLLPILKAKSIRLKTIATASGTSAGVAAQRFGFENASSDVSHILNDDEINTVFVLTRHDSHARFVMEALRNGKNVFVEKPLATSLEQLSQLEACYQMLGDSAPRLMVGFNRRFSAHTQKITELLAGSLDTKAMVMTVNAGRLPPNHWLVRQEIGGGRLVGEACHFIDLLRHIAQSPIVSASTNWGASSFANDHNLSINLAFEDGSIGTIHYLVNGDPSLAKERLEIFCGGKVLQLDNFKKLRGYGWPNFKSMNLWAQDKGHRAEIASWLKVVEFGGDNPIPVGELFEVSRATLQASLSL